MIAIDKGIPIPEGLKKKEKRDKTKYPFRIMEVGDSFFVETLEAKRVFNSLRSQTYSLSKDSVHKGKDFFLLEEAKGVRVWRTK